MAFWTHENIQQVLGGTWIVSPTESMRARPLGSVTTDSRELVRGSIFFARKGAVTDGHEFLKQAAEAGSTLLVVDNPAAASQLNGSAAVLHVEDSTAALGQLATAYRQTLGACVVAVTGSAGKTTTRMLIDAVLRMRYTGRASPKSYNNQVGVPLTILSAQASDEYLVVEIGTNAPGEVAALAHMAQPDIAVITHVGSAHLEGLGGIEGVLREKASLLNHLREGGLAVVNGDVPGLLAYRNRVSQMVTFGRGRSCDVRVESVQSGAAGVCFAVDGRKFRLPLLGEHNAINALAAVAVGRHMGLSDAQIAEGLAAASPPPMRLVAESCGPPGRPVVLLNDCYNANPDSMAAALDVLASYPTRGRRVAVLGDMGELGERGPDLHRTIGQKVVDSGIDAVIFIGRLSLFAAEVASRRGDARCVYMIPAWDEQTPANVAAHVQPGDTVLIKASRAMGFEGLIPAIRQRFAAAGP